MKNQKKPEILYSRAVNEIMGRPPGKIVRWGTTLCFAVFVLFILLAWLIKYPDTIPLRDRNNYKKSSRNTGFKNIRTDKKSFM